MDARALPSVNRRWLLARRPAGLVSAADFTSDTQPIPEPGEGEVVVRNTCISCDPTQRGWMAGDTYMPAVKIGEVMRSFAAGRVVASRDPKLAVGDMVSGLFGWQDYAVATPRTSSAARKLPGGVPVETALSVLGLTGQTAYFGLIEVGKAQPGETVVVSGAAGATGSVVGQIGKILGCRVIGIAGGKQKCDYLLELGFDGAIDYKSEDVKARLGQLCEKGIDVFFDNVGGEILDAALARLALHARVVICGAIARYGETTLPPGPKNYMNLLIRRSRMEGFLVMDYAARTPEALTALSTWLKEGRLRDRVDVQHGLENAPATLARLFTGDNQGKQLLRIAPDAD